MKRQHLTAIALILCTALITVAAGTIPASPNGFDSGFIQTRTLQGFKSPLISRGNVRIDKIHGFRWEITSPYHYVFQMNGGSAEEQLPDGSIRELKTENTPWLGAVERVFVGALAGDQNELQKYFNVQVTRIKSGQEILLTPKSASMATAIDSILLTESAPGHPQQLKILEKSGDKIDIRFVPESSIKPGS